MYYASFGNSATFTRNSFLLSLKSQGVGRGAFGGHHFMPWFSSINFNLFALVCIAALTIPHALECAVNNNVQECIPVGCVPPPAVAVHGGVGWGLPQCMLGYTLETPWVWAWRTPLGCQPGDHPGVGLETPLARPLNFLPGRGPGDHTPYCKAC